MAVEKGDILSYANIFPHATQPGLQQWKVDRTSATVPEEWAATHLVYDLVKVNGFVWICT